MALTKLTRKNLIKTLYACDGAALWQHLYVEDGNGDEFDATRGGELSCALFVSSILSAFGLIDMSHATVATTLNEMERAGWYKIKQPRPGAVVEYPIHEGHPHIGFALEDGDFISNNAKLYTPTIHKQQMDDGREPIAFYWHDKLN